MEFENLLKLIDTVSKSELDSFLYEENGIRIKLGKNKKNVIYTDCAAGNSIPDASAYAAGTESAANVASDDDVHIIKSPLVGIFYAAPGEDLEPFVSVGDTVKKGQTLSIIEAMKLMNEIESDFDGIVKEIYVKNGDAVEYGQPLFCIG